ncbi:DegT/DnrJ/EryC1/StrS aminotransferase family protein [Hyphomonas sp.]|uniref:DegT/DnrJ/EryC1/StrS family aminotransferase n=1 Tax=Hyphomonas sp. TaxID=87 RepID=UPI0025C45A22|nr:DegT/DnrJ/EryC1/StrS family aminotransferase [Hyphomonas sp.]
MKRIEFGELRIGEIARKNLNEVCDTNWASNGPKVKELESKWSGLFDYEKSVATSSGTDGCINACLSLYDLKGAERNVSEVIVPALSFIATSNAVRAAGLVPRFVDVKKETLNIDETKIEEAINENTVAIQVVHTMGRMAEMDVICEIAEKHGLIVIEDACEAHGAKFKDKFVGHWGDMSVYSFYVAHLICCGEGGMVSTNNEEIANLIFSTRSHGRPLNSVYFDHLRTGINSKMNDLEASIGLEAIEVFWDTFWTRHGFMKRMRESVVGFEDVAWFSEEDEGNINCPHGFSITCKKEGDIQIIMDTFDKYNIHHKRNFGCIPTQHAAFADMGYTLGDFPEAEWVGVNGVHIGCHQYLSDEDVERICTAMKEGLEKCRGA